jgi:hypothetical protein
VGITILKVLFRKMEVLKWRLASNSSVNDLVWGFREEGGSPFQSVKAIVIVL